MSCFARRLTCESIENRSDRQFSIAASSTLGGGSCGPGISLPPQLYSSHLKIPPQFLYSITVTKKA